VKINSKVLTGFYAIALSLVFSTPILAADAAQADDAQKAKDAKKAEQAKSEHNQGMLEEVITTGTRSTKPRSAADSPVPVDVLSGEDG